MIHHLMNSRVQVQRMTTTVEDGRPRYDWQDVPGHVLACRLDMSFLRPGKDVPLAAEAGKAPDRIGVLFCAAYTTVNSVSVPSLKAGDRVMAVPNPAGRVPVPGIFEIATIPDLPQDFSDAHHMEVQIREVSQMLTMDPRAWPLDT